MSEKGRSDHTFRPGDIMWLVDDSRDGIASVTVIDPAPFAPDARPPNWRVPWSRTRTSAAESASPKANSSTSVCF